MGRRLNVSTPTVINTELVPLDESFYLEVDGQMEQWYYDNTEQYAPNRKVTPLLLTPVISAFDKDTNTSYTPTFNTTQWFANEWNEAQGKYVETEITNQVDSGSADYVKQGNNLLVKKNVSYSHAVTIRCVATYIDPRDSGVTYTVEDSVNLTTNRTADVVFPEVDIISPSARAYNPLVDDDNSQYDFKGVTTNNPVQPLNTDVRRYTVDVDGTEEILNSGEAVAPIMDIHYGDNPTMADQEFMYRQTAGGALVGESIDKAYIERIKGNTVTWSQKLTKALNASGSNFYTNNGALTYNDGIFSLLVNQTDGNANTYPRRSLVSGHIYLYVVDMLATTDGTTICLNNKPFTLSSSAYKRCFLMSAGTYIVIMDRRNSDWDNIFFKNTMMQIDLTIIYGSGNEPETVEEFEADYRRWFGKPLSYEEYDAGSLRPVLMQSVKTTGFNQLKEVWERGNIDTTSGSEIPSTSKLRSEYIKILPSTRYYCKAPSGYYFFFYDSSKSYISNGAMTSSFTTPVNAAYIRILLPTTYGTTYNNDVCLNFFDSSKNGTYEPYEEKVQGFDVTAIKGKLNGAGESVTIFPDGLKKAGDIQDEIFVEDGVVKAIKRIGSVDLGSLTWTRKNDVGIDFFVSPILDAYYNSSNKCENAILGYKYANVASLAVLRDVDKTWVMFYAFVRGINIRDDSYTDAATFKTAMNGVMLYYELAEPQTYVLDPITDFVWYGIKNGQEVLADTLPWYVSGQGTDNLTVDAMYGENINVVLRCKMMDGETLSPSKAYATLSWRLPDIETFVQSDNGGAVRSDTEDMTFDTIVNINGDVLSDALKQKHLAFNWKIRKNNTSTEIDKGWGQRITIDASDLRNVKGSGSTLASTLVGNEVYLKGAYEEVTDNGEVVTYNGEKVYDRPVD